MRVATAWLMEEDMHTFNDTALRHLGSGFLSPFLPPPTRRVTLLAFLLRLAGRERGQGGGGRGVAHRMQATESRSLPRALAAVESRGDSIRKLQAWGSVPNI